MSDEIRTGDHILHRPSGETWLVAYVDGERLGCCGWPASEVDVADCELTKSCTDEECLDLLKKLAELKEPDKRGIYARDLLAAVDRAVINEADRAVLTG